MKSEDKMLGLDIYHGNGQVDWETLKSEIKFVFIKASEGLAMVDPMFQNNWTGTEKYQIPRGAYHFFRPNVDTYKQVTNFLKVVASTGKYDGELPPVLDLEMIGNAAINTQVDNVLNWLSVVQKSTGKTPIIYTNSDTINQLGNPQSFQNFPLWLAEYGVEQPRVPKPWDKVLFWQYTDEGSLSGVTGQVDLNYFLGSDLSSIT